MTRESDPKVEEIAMRICDGTEVDWIRVSSLGEISPEQVEPLRVLDRIAATHRHWTLLSTTQQRGRTGAGTSAADGAGDGIPETWGNFRIVEKIGAGGFGDVFRAFDPRLQLDVALKLFRSRNQSSTEALLAEARALARVNHPNVLAVRGADVHDGLVGMWTGLLRGRTLEQMVTQDGPFSARETILIGIDLCRALAAVHAAGFVHGDVKTSNVMREQGGRIVLMDFGTALEAPRATGNERALVGTPLAMAPELLRDGHATSASDVFALGVLLYRLLSGRYPVEARSLEELQQRYDDGDFTLLRDRRPDLPPRLVEVVERAMSLDPARRWASAGEMERSLTVSLADESQIDGSLFPAATQQKASPVVATRRPRIRTWVLAAIACLGIAGIVVAARALWVRPAGDRVPMRFSVQLPRGYRFSGYANSAVSPDGRTVVYAASDSSGTARLHVRRFDSIEARILPETEGAFYPFWSPDGRWVAFFARGALRKVSVEGGPAEEICKAIAGRGGSWNRNDLILFSAAPEGPIFQVRAAGSEPIAVTTLRSTTGEISHRWPCWLPDQEHFVFLSLPPSNQRFGLFAGSIHSDHRVSLGTTSSGVTWSKGALVYLDDQTLVRRAFDSRGLKFTGQAIAIADAQRFQGSMGEPLASVSGNGVLVFQNLGSRINELNWVDVRNLRASRLAEGPYFDPRLSPDGSRVAAERSESSTQSDLWLLDVSNGSTERLTSDPGLDRFPQWSEDGSRVLFATNREGKYALRMRSLSGSVGEQVVPTIPDVLLKWPTDWCPARGLMAYSAFQSQSAYDIWLRSDDGSCKPVVSTPASETGAMLTRDGEWMAFESNVSGRREIYCQRTQGGSVYRVSQAGGVLPHWRADGRELYFYSPASHELLAVRHSNGEFGAPRRLFQQPELLSYDVDAAGLRFLCCSPAASEVPDQLTVLVP